MRYVVTVLMLAMVFTAGCKSTAKSTAKALVKKATAGPKAANEEDGHYAALAAGKLHEGDRATEARAWLDTKNTNNRLWKTSREQTLGYVNTLYEAGAVKVYCVYAPKDETIPVNLCAELFVELPQDAEKRKKVIRAFNKIEKELWGDDAEKVKDEGQKYLDLNMDP